MKLPIKKFSHKTGRIMGLISLLMLVFALGFLLVAVFTKFGWWLDVVVGSAMHRLSVALHIPGEAWFWFLRGYLVVAVGLAVLAGYCSKREDKDLPNNK